MNFYVRIVNFAEFMDFPYLHFWKKLRKEYGTGQDLKQKYIWKAQNTWAKRQKKYNCPRGALVEFCIFFKFENDSWTYLSKISAWSDMVLTSFSYLYLLREECGGIRNFSKSISPPLGPQLR